MSLKNSGNILHSNKKCLKTSVESRRSKVTKAILSKNNNAEDTITSDLNL